MKVPDINYQEEIRKCKSMDDVVGKNGLMQRLLNLHKLLYIQDLLELLWHQ